MLRQPHETWWQQSGGKLRLTPQTETISGKANPSFLARRLQHAKFNASTSLTTPTESGVSAGLAVLQSETHHFFMGVRREGESMTVFLERRNGEVADVVATKTIPAASHLQLQLVGDEKRFDFSYVVDKGGSESLAANVDSMPVTVQAAGGGLHFTGAVIGVYTRIDPTK
jgi:alpha-N-arabinofuranosidase